MVLLTYHRVKEDAGANTLGTIVPLKAFKRQVESAAKKYRVVSLSEGERLMREGGARGTNIVLTFDDGYSDNYHTVFPLLRRMGLPAIFFLSTGYVGSGRPLWDSELMSAICAEKEADNIDICGRMMTRKKRESALDYAYRVFNAMKSADIRTLEGVLQALGDAATAGRGYADDPCMGWEDALRMREAGMEIGSHGVTHRSLARIPFEEAAGEIRESKAVIEGNVMSECRHFSFPFGSRNDYNGGLIAAVKSAGYATCLLNIHGYNHFDSDRYALKRIIMEEHADISSLLG